MRLGDGNDGKLLLFPAEHKEYAPDVMDRMRSLTKVFGKDYLGVFQLHTEGPHVFAVWNPVQYTSSIIPQDVADKHAEIAQKYWKLLFNSGGTPPLIFPDLCPLCQKTDEESARRRVAGFQWAIDKEIVRINAFGALPEGLPGEEEYEQWFEQQFERMAESGLPAGWYTMGGPVPVYRKSLLDLPLHYQVMMAVEWNHVLQESEEIQKYFKETEEGYLLERARQVLKKLQEMAAENGC